MSTNCSGNTGFALMALSEGTQDPLPLGLGGLQQGFSYIRKLFLSSAKKEDMNETAGPNVTSLLLLGPWACGSLLFQSSFSPKDRSPALLQIPLCPPDTALIQTLLFLSRLSNASLFKKMSTNSLTTPENHADSFHSTQEMSQKHGFVLSTNTASTSPKTPQCGARNSQGCS